MSSLLGRKDCTESSYKTNSGIPACGNHRNLSPEASPSTKVCPHNATVKAQHAQSLLFKPRIGFHGSVRNRAQGFKRCKNGDALVQDKFNPTVVHVFKVVQDAHQRFIMPRVRCSFPGCKDTSIAQGKSRRHYDLQHASKDNQATAFKKQQTEYQD
ncbi:hypothetical protein BGX27_010377 [Mortierella sp. AM989]|nr:hypothetical protein BGX27_010377 [Mortierella sp. AM989]